MKKEEKNYAKVDDTSIHTLFKFSALRCLDQIYVLGCES